VYPQVNSDVFPQRDGKILYVTSARINIPLSARGARRAIFHFNLERCDGSFSTPSMGRNNGKIYELRGAVEKMERSSTDISAEIFIIAPLLT